MNPPRFWTTDAWPARVLAPLGAMTAAATARRVAAPGWHCPIPVFCAGNATMGGAGKTTVALDLGRRLVAAGKTVHFLTRGYGRRTRHLLCVDPTRHDAALVGDEPLLLAAVGPTWVAADRAQAARAAIRAGADILVMDDGLQNPTVAGRRNALVIDGSTGFGNGRLFPAGPLREPIAAAGARCDLAIVIGEDAHDAVLALPPTLPILRATLVTRDAARLAHRRLHAFAGIAHPARFFRSLERAGATVAARTGFADHHPYARRTLERLLRAAMADRATLATTAKDAARIPGDLLAEIEIIDVTLLWHDEAGLGRWLGSA